MKTYKNLTVNKSPNKTSPQIASRSKTPQRKSISKSKQKISPVKLAKDRSVQIMKNRQNLTMTLDTYTLLIRSKNPIRCLEHNSNISIYCETEQKLLCANCIFGRPQHKFHRVTPIDRSYDKIQKDIQLMNRLIDRQNQQMKKTCQQLLVKVVNEQNDAKDSLNSLIHSYQQCHRLIEQLFIQSKQKLLIKLDQIRQTYDRTIMQIKLLIDNYSKSSIIKNSNRQYYKRQQWLLFQHVVCGAISSQKKFDRHQWLPQAGKIIKEATQQNKKILAITELVNRLLKIKNQT